MLQWKKIRVAGVTALCRTGTEIFSRHDGNNKTLGKSTRHISTFVKNVDMQFQRREGQDLAKGKKELKLN